MAFLYARCVSRRYVKQQVGDLLHLATGLACHRDDADSKFFAYIVGIEDILRVARSADSDKDIAFVYGPRLFS